MNKQRNAEVGDAGPGEDVDLGLRPLSARSVLASILLGTDPPELSVRSLVRTAEAFGIGENSARVALSRMVAGGELTVSDGRYRLAGALVERHAHLGASRRPPAAARRRWDGSWRLAVVTGPARPLPERRALRTAMVRGRFAEVREGVWTRPANLPRASSPSGAGPEPGVEWFAVRPDGDPAALAARLFDLVGWTSRTAALRAAMRDTARQPGDGGLAAAFVLDAAVLRHLQADPLLPPALLPDGWPGDALRRDYERFDAGFRREWRTWVRATA